MELKNFVKEVLIDLVAAVEEASGSSVRNITLESHKESGQTINFDVAVTAEDSAGGSAKGGVKVLGLFDSSADINTSTKNTVVSRVSFGVRVSTLTNVEKEERVHIQENKRSEISNRSFK